jgi:hypothetical protein
LVVIVSPLTLGGWRVGGETPARFDWRSKTAMASALVAYQRFEAMIVL